MKKKKLKKLIKKEVKKAYVNKRQSDYEKNLRRLLSSNFTIEANGKRWHLHPVPNYELSQENHSDD